MNASHAISPCSTRQPPRLYPGCPAPAPRGRPPAPTPVDGPWPGGPGRLSPGPPQLHLLLLAGHVLVTLREAFAVDPGSCWCKT